MRPALIAGALLAFTLSLDDFVITFFTSGPNTVTFPVKVYSMLRFSVTPEVNAASTMLIVVTIVLMALMMLIQGRGRKPRGMMNVDQVSPGGTAAAAVKPIISFRNICKRWGSTVGVDHVSLDIEPGEFFALLGPSGCGKTTLLRMLAGLEVPTEGQILIDGQDMGDIPPNKRAVNMVFQSYAVFPHMTVADNVAYGLKIDRVPQPARAERVQEALELVQLGQLADRKPDQLSGGQRQRVALARALVKRPESPAARRAAVGARRQASRSHALRTFPAATEGGHHVHHGHP